MLRSWLGWHGSPAACRHTDGAQTGMQVGHEQDSLHSRPSGHRQTLQRAHAGAPPTGISTLLQAPQRGAGEADNMLALCLGDCGMDVSGSAAET